METSLLFYGRDARPGAEAAASPPDLSCRVCELETENARLRLLVGELLVVNQRLREEAVPVRMDMD